MKLTSSLKQALTLNFILAAVLPVTVFAMITINFVSNHLLDEVVQDNLERDYTELIRVMATDPEGKHYPIEGTLTGRSQQPRLTRVYGRNLESPLDEKYLLVVENEDTPGIVGMLGTVLAKYDLNISNMSLSRNTIGGVAFNICGLDSQPPKEAIDEIASHKAICTLKVVNLNGS